MLRKLEIMGTGCLGGRGLPSASPQRHGSQFVCFLLTLRLTTAFRPHKLSASVSQQTDKACVTKSKELQANRKNRCCKQNGNIADATVDGDLGGRHRPAADHLGEQEQPHQEAIIGHPCPLLGNFCHISSDCVNLVVVYLD